MNGTLSLAASIAAMSREELRELVTQRRIASPEAIGDPLALAIELLRPDSISRALQTTHRDSLRALIALSKHEDPSPEHLDVLRVRGLVGVDEETGRTLVLPEVMEAVRGVSFSNGTEAPQPSAPGDTSRWFGQALASVRRAAELIRRLAARPVRLGRKGNLTIVSMRELSQEKNIDIDAVAHLLIAMQVAGLLSRAIGNGTTQLLVPTADAQQWLELDYPDRWLILADAALSEIDDRMRHDIAAYNGDLGAVVASARRDYPLLPDSEIQRMRELLHFCEELGIAVDGRLTVAALGLLGGEPGTARELAHQDFPAPVTGIYLQPDLSLIVPGPLAPADEAALSLLAESEQLGTAATMRVGPATLEHATRLGLGVDEIRNLLERLSLTGIPQPLEFLLTELEQRPNTEPVAHRPMVYAPPMPAPVFADEPHGPTALEQLIDRVLEAASSGEGDLSRRLKLAIRHRRPVLVTAVAGADKRVFTLLPVSLRDGRLRATDQQAGVERTLPVSAITAVEAA